MAYARRATVYLEYNGANISTSLGDYLESFSYTDSSDGDSDSISIQLNNKSGRWTDAWFPSKGDLLRASIAFDGSTLSCGTCVLDSFTASGGSSGSICNIGAIAMPSDEAFKATKRTKTWEKVNLSQIGGEIAGRSGVSFQLYGKDIYIESREQNEQDDCSFLSKLCHTYGYVLKAYNHKIVIFDPAELEKAAPVRGIMPQNVESWSYQTMLEGTYTGAKLSYTSSIWPNWGKTVDVEIGGGERILSLNEKADSLADAQLIAGGRMASENRKSETVSLNMMMDLRLVSGSTILLSGFGRIDGRYMISKATHSVRGSGSKSQIEAYRIL